MKEHPSLTSSVNNLGEKGVPEGGHHNILIIFLYLCILYYTTTNKGILSAPISITRLKNDTLVTPNSK